MVTCEYCKTEIEKKQPNNGIAHNMCADIWNERVYRKICGCCGGKPTKGYRDVFCSDCNENTTPVGYT